MPDSRKRKLKDGKYYRLQSFLQPGCPISLSGPFRDNVRLFLRECGQLEEYNVEGMPIWCTFLVHENRGIAVPLYTIEECVKNSVHPLCDHCRCSGWSHHFVSKRKYHFIIPIDNDWNKPIEDGVLDLQTHILHGLIHSNGFGHLLCINGFEGGSKFVCGRDVMDLWDRICTTLHCRKISVVDTSRKRNMDLRLLYGVSYGHTWFGRWDYEFCLGSFGITKDKYDRALEILNSLELDSIVSEMHQRSVIKKLICRYRDMCDTKLITVRDLFRFMLSLKYRVPQNDYNTKTRLKVTSKKEKNVKCRKFSNMASKLDSRWSVKRLEDVANVVVNGLKKTKNCGMSRQEVRDMARLYIGDTGLIDYVLKSMNNVIVGEYVVRRAVNSRTGVLEYSLKEVNQNDESVDRVDSVITRYTQNDVYKDVAYLYQHVLMESDYEMVEFAVRTILDCKNFTKTWPFNDDADEFLRFICRVIPLRKSSVGEIVVVPLHATMSELKTACENAMQDTYCAMEKLKVTGIVELEGLDDNEVLFGSVESGSEITIHGFGVDLLTSDLGYEGGEDNWVVSCKCGAKDDDGERMIACDVCEVWQHTRCIGIDDGESVPSVFMCYKCCDSISEHMCTNRLDGIGFVDWMMVLVVSNVYSDLCY
ncbi:PHD finger protein MALE MEIOCYTE DEATH 1-like [Rutidosis leptorrhynchoides]|uniref:PHD finger protein MALE MEIOCYTE DEATH 1-like n=1 Tax=Rutidosis leptorrhynchoides TaxID=125765 RepID=UPI003A99F33A